MLDFMDYIQLAFSDASGWNRDNSYTSLTDTAKAILDFTTPERFRVHLSSLSTPQFATSYTIGTVGLIDGSISYLFTTLPLNDTPSRSTIIPLRNLVPGYRQVYRPLPPLSPALADDLETSDSVAGGPLATRPKPSLLHATLHLPPPTTLTALFLHRPSPTSQLSLALWSTQASLASKSGPPQACLLTRLSQDTGKYSSEFLFSTDNSLLGFKGLWNFGPDPRKPKQEEESTPKENKKCRKRPAPSSVSLLSAGGEAYYSPVSSVVGLSTGLRFTTLPAASAPTSISTSGQPISTFPYTLTLTLTPLAGALSATYSLLASQNLAFSSRFGFNVYSWESEMVAGCELWRRNQRTPPTDDLEWAKRKLGLLPSTPHHLSHVDPDSLDPKAAGHETNPLPPELEASSARSTFATSSDSVIKMRVDQSWNLRFLWEGRVKDLLVSAGVALGPSAPTSSSGPSVSPTAGSSSTRGYGWTGVGVSVLYST